MDLAPEALYRNDGEYILVIFDLRYPQALERLHRTRAAWQARLELIDKNHVVLVIKPGEAARKLSA
jgi:hypothetical protein